MAIIEIKVPSPGESISQVELYKWLITDGAIIKKDTEIAELESDKATLILVAEAAGKVSLKATEGDTLNVGAIACTIDTSIQPEESDETAPEKERQSVNTSAKTDKPKADTKPLQEKTYNTIKVTPLARKVMEENDLSIEEVIKGLQRLKREHVEAAMNASNTFSANELKKPASRESKSERMSNLRRKLSERLVSVKNETAMLTTFNEVDMKSIMELRKKHQQSFVETHGIKLGFMSFFMKACSFALQHYRNLNAMMDGENIVSYGYTDISVAVSTTKGLMVPVIRNVESLGLAEIEKAISDVSDKARKGTLSIPEMTGGTFTITNGGIFGSMLSTPIINPPQSAILGMHNILERPVAIEGKVVIRPMMYIALSYDHRVIDGRDSVGFLVKVKQLLENPTAMLYGGDDTEKALLEL